MLWRKNRTEKPKTQGLSPQKTTSRPEQRSARRYPTEWRVSFSTGEDDWTVANVTNASTEGISFVSPEPCPLHVPFALTISAPGCAVVHAVIEPIREDVLETGILYGARFLRFTGQGEEALQRALLASLQENWARENYVGSQRHPTKVLRIRKRG